MAVGDSEALCALTKVKGDDGSLQSRCASQNAEKSSDYLYRAKTARSYKTAQGQGPTLDTLYVDRLSLPSIQGVIEAIARGREESRPGAGDGIAGYPSKANHLLLCRMRTVEVVALTDAHASEQGLYIARRKRSNDNIMKWSPRLREAWEAALAVREQILSRRSNAARPFRPSPSVDSSS